MNYYEVALVKSARSATGVLTYHSEEKISLGFVVELKVRSVDELGVVLKAVKQPDFKTKPIEKKLEIRLEKHLLFLATWISQYYQAPIGLCVRLLVPSGLLTKRRNVDTTVKPTPVASVSKLTKEQINAIRKLSRSNETSLLHGVTGSGKTLVYVEMAKKTLALGRSTIVLVPEISLTAQLVQQFEQHFEDVVVTHSNMTASARHNAWTKIAKSTKPVVVIGPRSALFMPIKNLGLVVLDECHDDSYKQANAPRYNTLKVARRLCDLSNAKLILGSATPAITDYFLAQQRSAVVTLDKPIKSIAGREVSLIDMRAEQKNQTLSKEALNQIEQALRKNEQILVYHNRRGTSPLVICSNCSWTADCPNCHIPMVLHQDKALLKCHSCGRSQKLPTSCPVCENTDIVYRGFGTKKIEQELKAKFPDTVVARFDTDNKTSESLAKRYDELRLGEIDILVGTQMIAKGLDLPKLNTGIVVSADTGLSIPDFSTNEKVFQLLHQVIGRVGRHSKHSYVGIQTFAPDNHIIKLATQQDYQRFYSLALKERKTGEYPPFKHLLLLTCSYASRTKAQQIATQAMHSIKVAGVEIVGPAPSFYERLGTKYRWQLLVKSNSRSKLLDISEQFLAKPSWSINLDPVSLL